MALRLNQIPINDMSNYTVSAVVVGEVYAINSKSFMPVTGQQTSDMSSKFRYKMILEVQDSAGTVVATIKQRPNSFSDNYPVSIFDIRGIMNSLTSFTYYSQDAGLDPNYEPTIHDIGQSCQIISANSGNFITYKVELKEEYADTLNGDLITNTGPTITLIAIKSAFDQFQYHDPLSNFVDIFTTERWVQTYYDRRFLTILPTDYNMESIIDYRMECKNQNDAPLSGYIQYVERYYDLHTLALFNRGNGFTYVRWIKYEFFKKDGTKCKISGTDYTDVFLEINSTNGAPTYDTASQTDANSLIFVGVGGRNIRGFQGNTVSLYDEVAGTFTSTNSVDWGPFEHEDYDYYQVSGWSSVTGNTNQQKTAAYKFVHQDKLNCKGEETIRLAWINRLGTYEYFNFTGSWSEVFENTNKGIEPVVGADSLSSDRYRIRSMDGKKAVTSTMIRKAKLRTGLLSEHENVLMQSLFTSPEVFYIYREQQVQRDFGSRRTNTGHQRVEITNKSFSKQYKSKGERVKFEIDIQFSNAVLTNTI
jgi:hypothetical protein